MPLLIDGYNLLHVSGVFGSGTALTELHRSREALLAYLAASLEPAQRSHVTIVFDAAGRRRDCRSVFPTKGSVSSLPAIREMPTSCWSG